MTAAIFYILCAVIALACSILLMRAYARTHMRLLLWSCICFLGLGVSNLLVFIDLKMTPPDVDLYPLRLAAAAISMLILLYGLIWEGDR